MNLFLLKSNIKYGNIIIFYIFTKFQAGYYP